MKTSFPGPGTQFVNSCLIFQWHILGAPDTMFPHCVGDKVGPWTGPRPDYLICFTVGGCSPPKVIRGEGCLSAWHPYVASFRGNLHRQGCHARCMPTAGEGPRCPRVNICGALQGGGSRRPEVTDTRLAARVLLIGDFVKYFKYVSNISYLL